MKRKLLLHIGMRRTGTGSIAKLLWDNRAKLQSFGWTYPSIGLLETGHHLMPGLFLGPKCWVWKAQNAYLPGSDVNRFFKFLFSEIEESGCNNVILLSPLFSYLSSDAIDQLHSYFSDYELSVLIYLRRQDAWAESLYRDAVCNPLIKFTGHPEDLPLFGGEPIQKSYPSESPNFFDYHALIAPWENNFGRNALLIREYSEENDRLLQDFWALLGLPSDVLPVNFSLGSNRCLSTRSVHLLRKINTLDMADEEYRAVSQQFVKAREKEEEEFVLSHHLRTQALEAGRKGNALIAQNHLKRNDSLFAANADNVVSNTPEMPKDVAYTSGFYFDQAERSLRSARIIISILDEYFSPQSVVDVGCGLGTWLLPFLEQGVDVVGLDGDYVRPDLLYIPKDRFISRDLTKCFANVGRRFDLAMSLEVAEHLPKSCGERFVKELTSLSDVVLFSAAVPGQGGTNHINEQWQSYWSQIFKQEGYVCLDLIRPRIWGDEEVDFWYRHGVLLYVRDDKKTSYFRGSDLRSSPLFLDIVHPRRFEITTKRLEHQQKKGEQLEIRAREEEAQRQRQRKELESLKDRSAVREEHVKKLEAQVTILKDESKRQEERIKTLVDNSAEHKIKFAQLEAEKELHKKRYSDAQVELDQTKANLTISKLEAQLRERDLKIRHTEIESLRKDRDLRQIELEKASAELQQLRETLKDNENILLLKIESLRKDQHDRQADLEKSKVELRQLRETLSDNETDLVRRIRGYDRQCARLARELAELRNSVSFAIGQAFVDIAVRPVKGTTHLLPRLFRIAHGYLRQNKKFESGQGPSENKEVLPLREEGSFKAIKDVPLAAADFKLPQRPRLVFSITTYNRVDYLRQCLETFLATCNRGYDWTIIIADDGSQDETHEYLKNLSTPFPLYILYNQRRYCVGQTNTIFALSRALGFDAGFKADDDVIFKQSGWDKLYLEAMGKSGLQHLCYMNYEHFMWNRRREDPNFPESERITDPTNSCESISNAYRCMGAFFSFTPSIVESVGACDENNFPVRGQWHIDFSVRCCRAGFNSLDTFFDARGSNDYIELQNNLCEDYRCSIPWNADYAKTKDETEMKRRYEVIDDPSRLYLPLPEQGVLPKISANGFFDKIFVLNLDRRPDRWELACRRASRCGLSIERFPAVDGSCSPHKGEWEAYIRESTPNLPGESRPVKSSKEYYLDYESDLARIVFIEQKTGTRSLASPGAWGYRKTMIGVLEKALREGYESILVLDDDFVCHKDFKNLFSEIIHQVPRQWKVIQLGVMQYNWGDDWITWHSRNMYHCNGSSVASHAVGIHRSAFELLLKYTRELLMPFDDGALHKITHILAKECFVCYPNLIVQDVSESDINTGVQKEEGIKEDNVYQWHLEDYDFCGREPAISKTSADDRVRSITVHAKKNAKVRILHFRETFSPPSETFIYDMLCNLERYTETDNYMLTFKRLLDEERPFAKCISLGWENYRNGLGEKSYREIGSIVRDLAPDVMIAHFGLSAEILYHSMQTAGLSVPMIVNMHGYDVVEVPKQRSDYVKIIRAILNSPNTAGTYTTENLRESITSNLGIPSTRLFKVNNAAKDIFFKNRKTKFWQPDSVLNLINVGRMVPIKGQRFLLGGFASFRNKVYPNSLLTIIGANNDELLSELKEYATKLKIENYVRFLDHVTPHDLINLLSASDVYIQPSCREAFGITLLEAILVGLPVVATEVGGIPELIGNAPETAARLVPPGDEEAIALALGELFVNGGISADNYDYALDRYTTFSLEKQMTSLLRVIAEVCPSALDISYLGPEAPNLHYCHESL